MEPVSRPGRRTPLSRLWEAESGRLLLTFMALPADEWVIYTPNGDYTCSPCAKQYLFRRDGEDIMPVNE